MWPKEFSISHQCILGGSTNSFMGRPNSIEVIFSLPLSKRNRLKFCIWFYVYLCVHLCDFFCGARFTRRKLLRIFPILIHLNKNATIADLKKRNVIFSGCDGYGNKKATSHNANTIIYSCRNRLCILSALTAYSIFLRVYVVPAIHPCRCNWQTRAKQKKQEKIST